MISTPPTMIVPLQMDEHGTIRVSGTRVTLDVIIARYHQGRSPESIHEGFPTVPINDIYAVISYYLAHHDELDVYLKQQNEEAERIRQEWEAQYPPKITRAELMARLKAKQDGRDA